MAVPQLRMSLEAFLELPEDEPALEYEDGVVTQKVPPQGKHASLQPWICELVNRLAAGEKGKMDMLIPRAELVINKKIADKLKIEIPPDALKAANKVF